MRSKYSVPILIADDDMDDCQMIREALFESHLLNEIHFVHDGEQLIEFLNKERNKAQGNRNFPGLILLDLNMPKMDGREVLKELKNDPEFLQIPIIVLTTSQSEEDIVRSYNLGANSFITKPVEFETLVHILIGIGKYWFDIVKLPASKQDNL